MAGMSPVFTLSPSRTGGFLYNFANTHTHTHTHTHKPKETALQAHEIRLSGGRARFPGNFTECLPLLLPQVLLFMSSKALEQENNSCHKYLWEIFGLMLVAIKWHCWERVILNTTKADTVQQAGKCFRPTFFGKLKRMKMLLKFFLQPFEHVKINRFFLFSLI